MTATNVQAAIEELNEKIEEGGEGITEIPVASSSVLGGVKVGDGLSITSDGALSANVKNIPTATSSVLGGIKVGSGLSITTAGVLSCITQTKVQQLIDSAISATQIGTYKAKINVTYSSGFSKYYKLTLAGSDAISGTMTFTTPQVTYNLIVKSYTTNASHSEAPIVTIGGQTICDGSIWWHNSSSWVGASARSGKIDITGYTSTALAISCKTYGGT